jgi:hypothetical protein
MYLLCIDVGPVCPVDFSRIRWHPRPEVVPTVAARLVAVASGGPPAGEAKRVLRRVDRNLTALTRAIPMVEIEDFPPTMQPHVVGLSRTWVKLF